MFNSKPWYGKNEIKLTKPRYDANVTEHEAHPVIKIPKNAPTEDVDCSAGEYDEKVINLYPDKAKNIENSNDIKICVVITI